MKLPIPDKIKKTWDMWNLRGCIILSLFLQAFLALLATSRRRFKNSFLLFLIWGAYLLADWIAAVAIGLSIKSQDNDKSCEATKGTNQDIAAFWASFLLLHLGGPDSITSFALEDNEFWLRHLLGLFLQALAAAYSLYLSLPKNKLWPLAVLVYLVGIVKYAERTRALYLASGDSLVANLLPKPEPGPDYEETSTKFASRWMLRFPIHGEATRMPNTSSVGVGTPNGRDLNVRGNTLNPNSLTELELLRLSEKLFKKSLGLIAGLHWTTADRELSRNLFLEITDHRYAFRLIENEFSFLFDVLHTKLMIIMHNRLRYIVLRSFSFSILFGTAIFFPVVDVESFDNFDIIPTFALLFGAIFLDAISVIRLFLSDFNIVFLRKSLRKLVPGIFLRRSKWSRLVFQYNMLDYCLDERPKRLHKFAALINLSGTLDKIKIMWCSSSEKVTEELERFIFDYVKGKSPEKAIDLRDALTSHTELKWSLREFNYIESLLLWHIATEICLLNQNSRTSSSTGGEENGKRKWWKLLWRRATKICHLKENSGERKCKLLSDYMFYLLITQPKMFSTILGSWYIVFQDTFADAKRFFSKHSISDHSNATHRMLSSEVESRPKAPETESKSVFYAAIRLAKELQRLGDDRWDIMDRMWVELMCYAAINCRLIVHAQQVGMGGELLSFTWLLMKHFGLGVHFSAEHKE